MDMYDILLARNLGSGGTVDAYTKAETDALLADKADLSILQPMTQAEYDAIVTKTAPLYFIYEDGGNP